MCDQYFETIDHLVPGCNVICPTKYKKWMWQSWLIHTLTYTANVKAPCKKSWYEHKQIIPLVEADNTTILWGIALHTDWNIDANKQMFSSKIIKATHVYWLTELVFPLDKNFSDGEFCKIVKYNSLEIAIERIWSRIL